MSRLSPLTTICAASFASVALVSAQSAQAQSGHYGYDNRGYGHERRAPTWRDQRDRPGDYRCDAYWDASRTDCHERWRDQRPRHVDNRSYRDRGHYGQGRGYAQHHDYQRYAAAVGGANVWPGVYGRPDLVYPGAGYGQVGGRDRYRMDWCRATYRSYDPASGYYRAYSGRLVYCG